MQRWKENDDLEGSFKKNALAFWKNGDGMVRVRAQENCYSGNPTQMHHNFMF